MKRSQARICTCFFMLSISQAADAYVGPTLGLGIVGTIIAVILVSLLSLFAFVFVPLKRLWNKKKGRSRETGEDNP